MKKLLIFFLLAPFFSFAQKLPGFGFEKVTINDGNETIKAELLPYAKKTDVKIDRYYYWYSANIIHTTQGGFSGSLLNGSYSKYYLTKNLMEQGTFKNGLKDGVWKNWDENGFLRQMYTWKDGLLYGKFVVYGDNGKIKDSGKYRKGILIKKDSSSFFHKFNLFKKNK